MRLQEQHIGFDNAVQVLKEGLNAISGGDVIFDFSNVQKADSAAIAVVLDWIRHAQSKGLECKVLNAPDSFNKLVRLYGLNQLFP